MKPDARLVSLDVFRGATIASMILVNNPGTWGAIYAPLEHAEWSGWTFTDLIFPFFLWISGVSMTISFARRIERGDGRTRLLLHTLRRAALLFCIGLFLAGFPRFNLHTIRIPGVLQRIAVCYAIAAAIFLFTRVRGQVLWILGLLAAYWYLMGGEFSKEHNFARYIDGVVLSGHMWRQTRTWDPEGIVSTLPAIASTLFGILVGHMLRWRKPVAEIAAWLFCFGNALLFLGLVLNTWMPINKSLWTDSFAVFMAGMAADLFAIVYWLIEGAGWRRWGTPFAIYGMNALAVFVLSGFIAKSFALLHWQEPIYNSIFAPLASPKNASLLFAIANVLFFYLIAWLLYRKKWFLRL